MITCYTDGACEPYNPGGVATSAFIVTKNNKKIYSESLVVGQGKGMTSNVAEYTACLMLVQWLLKQNYHITKEEIKVLSDSQLVVNQLSGKWKVNAEIPKYFVRKIKPIIETLNISFTWIRRNQNYQADKLTKIAYENYCVKHNIPIRYNVYERQLKFVNQAKICPYSKKPCDCYFFKTSCPIINKH